LDKIAIVTTSWDDGHPCDFRLADELAQRNLPATFYVPLTGEGNKSVLPGEALRTFRKLGFEIGAHTVSHRILRGLEQKELSREVRDSKRMLEELLGSEVHMFYRLRSAVGFRGCADNADARSHAQLRPV